MKPPKEMGRTRRTGQSPWTFSNKPASFLHPSAICQLLFVSAWINISIQSSICCPSIHILCPFLSFLVRKTEDERFVFSRLFSHHSQHSMILSIYQVASSESRFRTNINHCHFASTPTAGESQEVSINQTSELIDRCVTAAFIHLFHVKSVIKNEKKTVCKRGI